jgi:hypothetical protein
MQRQKQIAGKCNDTAPAQIWLGCLLWVLFSLLVLALRGVQWDEDFEFAQAMVGQVPYPTDHPLVQYTRGAYNLQFYSAAGILLLTADPAVLCAIRNFLFILSTVLPVYLLTVFLSRRSLAGHAAVALILTGVHLEFDGAYPQFLWPGMFSNGHIGIAYALITVALIARGHLRSSALLLGLMPAAHLGQLAPLLLMAGLYTLWLLRKGETKQIKCAAPYFAIGLLTCIAFFAVQQHFAVPPPTDGPYFSQAEAKPLWAAHVVYRDMHRRIPVGNSHLIAAATVLLSVLWLRVSFLKNSSGRMWPLLLVYAAGVLAIVYGIMAVQFVLGASTPYVLIGWLPYRLANHLPPILLAMILAALWRQDNTGRSEGPLRWLVTGALAFIVAKPLLSHVVGPDFYARYLHTTDTVLFGLFGAAMATYLIRLRGDKIFFALSGLSCAAAWVALTQFHQFGAACTLAGASVGALLETGATPWTASLKARRVFQATCTPALVIMIALSQVHNQWKHRNSLPVGDFERRIAQTLKNSNEEDAMLVAPPHQVLLQAQTGHPVMTDMATEFHASYMPSLAPSVQNIYGDIYGIYFEQPGQQTPPRPSWQTVWEERSLSEWQHIGNQYEFAYVVAPSSSPLVLDPVISDDDRTLYRIRSKPAPMLERSTTRSGP